MKEMKNRRCLLTGKWRKITIILGEIIVAALSVAGLQFWIRFPANRVFMIDDQSYTYSLLNQAIPVKIELLDSVWGSVVIDSIDEAMEYYDLIQELPLASSVEHDDDFYDYTVSGTISFAEGESIQFQADEYITIDGVVYGSENTKQNIISHTEKLVQWMFTKENLANLIGSHTRVCVRENNERSNLTVNQKKELRQQILNGKQIEISDELTEALKNRGKAVRQIEIYVSDKNERVPQVYIVEFESGFWMIHDERMTGSVMYMSVER